jgi:hypothetical protein
MNPKAIYRSNLQLQAQLPLFFQAWWLDIVSKDWDVLLVGEGNGITCVWPICKEQKFGLHIYRNPLLTPYLGPYFIHPDREQATLFEKLWVQLPKWDSFDLEAGIDFQNDALFGGKGFDTRFKDTYVLSLGLTIEQLFSNIHSNHRNLIRQATDALSLEEDLKHLPVLLSLHKETFARKEKSYPFDAAMIEKLVVTSVQNNCGCLLSAMDASQKVIASIFTVWDKTTMYLLLSTVNINDAHPGAVRMLIWEVIKKAKALNLSSFDFEGSMDPGIAAFFRRFGGERKTYLCASKTNSVIWNLKKKLLG